MPSGAQLSIDTIEDVTVVSFEDTRILGTVQIEAIKSELNRLVTERKCQKLILEFSRVQFLASSAVGALLNLQKQSSAIKGTLVISGLKDKLLKIFEIMKIKKLFTFCPTLDEALQHFGLSESA